MSCACRFRDLAKIGEECARHGVKAIQLVGWNDGGQDQGNPSHNPDPRLGTFDELKEAIRQIQALGVKVVLFANSPGPTAAPTGSARTWSAWRSKILTAIITCTQATSTRPPPSCWTSTPSAWSPCAFSSQEYLELCDREFQKTVELGADGILFDECLHHGPAVLCFDQHHGHRYGAPVYANDRKLIQNFHKIVRPGPAGFSLCRRSLL